jgi:hypothetical protein
MSKKLGPVLLSILWLSCAEEKAPDLQPLSWPIINGQPDRRLDHMAVVAVMSRVALCSGTLIAPRVVLTAAHCIQNVQVGDLLVLFGLDIRAAVTRGVVEMAAHPSYKPTGQTSPGDLALLLLTDGAPPGVDPIPHLPATLSLGQADVGREIQFVGFGQDENGAAGIKLYGDASIDVICTTPGGCRQGNYYAEFNTICQDQIPAGICFGDSGGPALVVIQGREYVAGVSSYVAEGCLNWGCSTKIDAYADFIEQFIRGRPGQPCQNEADCRSGVCRGGICCEGSCEGACFSCALPGSFGSCRQMSDDSPCPDGDLCNGSEFCREGVCLSGTPLECFDGNPCTEDRCFAASGCVFQPLADGTPCPDDDACNGIETCQAGQCAPGSEPDCDDGNPCTSDFCQSDSGCHHLLFDDGTECGQNACGQLYCKAGECRLDEELVCDDGNVCTDDLCDPQLGCQHRPAPDGLKCGRCQICSGGQCLADPDCASSGCGCSPGGSGGGAGGGLFFGLFLLLLWRRL